MVTSALDMRRAFSRTRAGRMDIKACVGLEPVSAQGATDDTRLAHGQSQNRAATRASSGDPINGGRSVAQGAAPVVGRTSPYSIPSGVLALGGGKSASICARSSAVSPISTAAMFSRTWAGSVALGIAMTPGWARVQASAIW